MPLLNLPNELLILIAESLQFSKDIASFLLTNRHLAYLLTPQLHHRATQSYSGFNALHWAASKGHKELIKLLVQKKNFDINAPDNLLGQPALHHAINKRTSFSVRKLLVELGSDVNLRTRDGRQALHMATYIGCEDTVRLLVEKGACIDSVDGRGQTVLFAAAYTCSPSIMGFLLKSGADVNLQNQDGQTALHAAVYKGLGRTPFAVVKLLLESGIDISVRSNSGYTARDHAVYQKAYKMVELLDLEKGSADPIL